MSALTETRHLIRAILEREATPAARARGIDPDDVDIDGRVEAYHRDDGYRTLKVSAPDPGLLAGLWKSVEGPLVAASRNVRVHPAIERDVRSGYALHVSIWKAAAFKVEPLETQA